MQGELPQELSVTALEVLGTGTGHAEGSKYTASQVRPVCPVKTGSHLACNLLCLHFLMVEEGSRKGWLKNVSAGFRRAEEIRVLGT